LRVIKGNKIVCLPDGRDDVLPFLCNKLPALSSTELIAFSHVYLQIVLRYIICMVMEMYIKSEHFSTFCYRIHKTGLTNKQFMLWPRDLDLWPTYLKMAKRVRLAAL